MIAEELIKQLKTLDLSTYPYKEIKELISKQGKVGVVITTLHAGKSIIRARPLEEKEVIDKPADLSYKPQKFNKTYQRASTPYKTAFYGCVVPENLQPGELDNARVTAIFEASNLIKKGKEFSGEERVGFGRWVVTKDIPLITIVYHKDFVRVSSHTAQLYKDYMEFLSKHPQHKDDSLMKVEYLASEFAKLPREDCDYDYLISAVFSEYMIEKGFAGVYYPSVRTEGNGFNVAIAPHFTTPEYMQLKAAGECTLYKIKEKNYLDNDTSSELADGQQKFKLEPITDPKIHTGREKVYKYLKGEINSP